MAAESNWARIRSIEASVNYANERATVRYAPGATTRADLVAAVRKAGYDVVDTAANEDPVDVEAAAREADVVHQKKRLLVGVLFTLPLFLLSMGRDLGLIGPMPSAARCVRRSACACGPLGMRSR